MFSRLADKGWQLAQRIGTYLPFTAWNAVWRSLDKQHQSILDIGCADGDMMGFLNNRKRFYTVGMDIYEPYLRECKTAKTHSENILCDVRRLPFKDKSFDIVLFLETIEHLEKEEGLKVLQEIERIARREIIISTPVSSAGQEAYGGNPHQEHRSSWSPIEMRQRGYKVGGIGIAENWLVEKVRNGIPQLADKVLSKNQNSSDRSKKLSISHTFKLTDFMLRLPYYFIPGPVVYFLPSLAGHMMCTKHIETKE